MEEDKVYIICGKRFILPALPDPLEISFDDDAPEEPTRDRTMFPKNGAWGEEDTAALVPKRKRYLKKEN